MPTSEEEAKRKAAKQGLRQSERERFRSKVPIAPEQVLALFGFVDARLAESECDNSLKYVLLFLSQHGIEAQPLVSWLKECGGYCDCEVLANAEERFLEAFPELAS
jgi:Protein of unknown function (DUF2695)